ncbi:uncharacterized protein LOC135682536 [Rhopilema esculentum]|uniref:uncharacterized protein LOC135682536 n=1 Tax=Rhopilema esculentum TaxID=499914 RepID=UPI0031E23163|eukprot:gene14299-5336_t
MKLLTHNMLTSNIKGVKNGFPLGIEATNIEVKDVDFNPEFVSRMIPRLEWKALVETAQKLGHGEDLPTENITDDQKSDEEFLRKVHHILLEVEIMEGNLICPETGRKFPVSKGIPNMLLNEDEV